MKVQEINQIGSVIILDIIDSGIILKELGKNLRVFNLNNEFTENWSQSILKPTVQYNRFSNDEFILYENQESKVINIINGETISSEKNIIITKN